MYAGRRYGEWPYVYLCDDCGAYIGLHPHTDLPLGTLADKPLLWVRKQGKGLFLDLSAVRRWSRFESYQWLAEQMEIPLRECHWGWFDEHRCAQAEMVIKVELSRHLFPT